MPEPWDTRREALGAFIRSQRKLANLSLRQLAEMTSLSHPYLSQVERGLHQPSVRVLKLIPDALNVSAEPSSPRLGCWMATGPVPRRGPAGPTRTAQHTRGRRRSGYPR
jgi:transcriptional regulator with XRE-family HTH domain